MAFLLLVCKRSNNMFFAKDTSPAPLSDKKSVIIGVSPAALFLADILQTNGCLTNILTAPSKLNDYLDLAPFNIRPTRFQTRHVDFHFASAAKFQPDFCIMASTPETAASDLLFLSDSALKSAPIINLASFFNHRQLSHFPKIKEIRGYLNCCVNLEKNVLYPLESSPKLDICASSETAEEIRKLFGGSRLSINFSHNGKHLFWEHFAVFFLSRILLLIYDMPLSSVLARSELRQHVNSAVDELCLLAKKEKISLDAGIITARLYAIPDDCPNEIHSPAGLSALINTLPEINRFTTPELFNLCAGAVKKY